MSEPYFLARVAVSTLVALQARGAPGPGRSSSSRFMPVWCTLICSPAFSGSTWSLTSQCAVSLGSQVFTKTKTLWCNLTVSDTFCFFRFSVLYKFALDCIFLSRMCWTDHKNKPHYVILYLCSLSVINVYNYQLSKTTCNPPKKEKGLRDRKPLMK